MVVTEGEKFCAFKERIKKRFSISVFEISQVSSTSVDECQREDNYQCQTPASIVSYLVQSVSGESN